MTALKCALAVLVSCAERYRGTPVTVCLPVHLNLSTAAHSDCFHRHNLCTQAIEQDAEYLKAWQRRALVRKQLGNVMGCLDDLQHALLLVPSSAAISRELRSVLQGRVLETGLRLPEDLIDVPVNIEHASSRAATSQPGQECGEARSYKVEPYAPVAAQQQPQAVASAAASSKSVDVSTEAWTPAQPPPAAEPYASPGSGRSRPQSAASGRSASGRGSPLEGLELPSRPLRAPSTGADFESSWRGLKGDMGAQARYLRLIAPDALPRILRSSLNPQLLGDVVGTALQLIVRSLEATSEIADAELGVRVLQQLVSTQRFSMNAMLIPSARRKQLGAAWNEAVSGAAAQEHRDVLTDLRSSYNI